MPDDRIFLGILLADIIMAAIAVLIIWGAAAIVSSISAEERSAMFPVVLTASSIVFGFVTVSLTRLSGQLIDLNRHLSDVAKELLELHELVRNDSHLLTKKLGWKMKVGDFGTTYWFTPETDAQGAIQSAYRNLVVSVRSYVRNFTRRIVYTTHGFALSFLLVSIFASVLASVPDFRRAMLTVAISTLLSGTIFALFAWAYSNKEIAQVNDSLFNIRHQVRAGLSDLDAPFKKLT